MAPVADRPYRSIHPSTSPLPRQYQKPALTADHFTRIIAIQRFTGLSRNPDVSASSSWISRATRLFCHDCQLLSPAYAAFAQTRRLAPVAPIAPIGPIALV